MRLDDEEAAVGKADRRFVDAAGRVNDEAGPYIELPDGGIGDFNWRCQRGAPRRGGGAGVRAGPSRFGLKVRKCFVLVGGLHYRHLPKLAVIDLVRVFRFET